MSHKLPPRFAIFASSAAAAALLVSGCSEAEKAVNPGGDTKCSDFANQDREKKRVTVTKFLEQERRGESAPTDETLDASIVTIELMCSAQANPDTPIKKADLTGVLVPK